MLGSSSAKSHFSEDSNTSSKRSKLSRQDPTSHRIIEKRRRDRMNSCLSDLSNLIPAVYLRKGQTRVEKTEIIELAIRFIVTLNSQLNRCKELLGNRFPRSSQRCCQGQYYHGFMACQADVMRYLLEKEGYSANDTLPCNLRAYLHQQSLSSLPELTVHPIDLLTSDGEVNEEINGILPPSGSSPSQSINDNQESQTSSEIPPCSFSLSDNDNGNLIKNHHSICQQSSTTTTTMIQQDNEINNSQVAPPRYFKYKQDIHLRFHADSQPPSSNNTVNFIKVNQNPNEINVNNHQVIDNGETNNIIKPERMNEPPRHVIPRSSTTTTTTTTTTTATGSASATHRTQKLLPGFVLHVSGTHYVPVLVDTESIEPRISTNTNNDSDDPMDLFHPISIPVHLKSSRCVALQQHTNTNTKTNTTNTA